MNLTKVLVPEIILGRRSRHQPETDFYRDILPGIEFTPNGVTVLVDSDLGDIIRNDTNTLSHLAICKKFIEERPPVYHLCADFAKALIKIEDREIPTHFLNDFFGYISFPPNTVTDGEEYVEGAFVYIGEGSHRTLAPPEDWGKRKIWYTYTCQTREPDRILSNVGRGFFLLKSETVHQMLASYPTDLIMHHPTPGGFQTQVKSQPMNPAFDRHDLTRLIINTVLYLSSQDPVVMSLTPTFGKTNSQRKKHVINSHVNTCTLPVRAINWDYKAMREYTTETSFVESFPRWQRCGPRHSEIKLIWVREHLRNYQKAAQNGSPDQEKISE